MTYFTKNYIRFFKELEKNNEKSWFDENRTIYENDVKKPFQNFISDLNQAIYHFDKNIDPEIKNAIFRINRDIRFSKDKSPYNTVMKAAITKGGRKSANPGYYIGISHDHIGVGAGLYNLEKEELNKVRQSIADNTKSFLSIINDEDFKSSFPEILGDRLKKAPKEFLASYETCPIIANKQFYVMKVFDNPSLILKEDFLDLVLGEFQKASLFNKFLHQAIHGF